MKKIFKDIEKSNKEFQNLSSAQQRIAIARDVIAQLRAGFFKPRQGVYVDIKTPYEITDDDAQKFLQTKATSCTVCGLGSLLVCAVLRFDELSAEDVNNTDKNSIIIYLSDLGLFNFPELGVIEREFENWDGASWLSRSIKPAERLRLIMENIIVNGGSFNLDTTIVRQNGRRVVAGYVG